MIPPTPCPECGFDFSSVTPDNASESIRGIGRRYRIPLTRLLRGETDGVLRIRPQPPAWSALEYAGHVRDVFALFDRRVAAVLAEDHPDLEVVDHDQAAEEGRYNEADPATVASQLAEAADRLAARVGALEVGAWARWGTRQGETRTVLEIAQRAVHEGHHHLLDIGRTMRAARAADPDPGTS